MTEGGLYVTPCFEHQLQLQLLLMEGCVVLRDMFDADDAYDGYYSYNEIITVVRCEQTNF